VELCILVLCRPSCNSFGKGSFVKDSIEDSEIFHNGEGRDVEQWLESQNNSFVFAIACVLLSIAFYFSYLCGCSLLNIIACISSITFTIDQYSSQQGGN